MPLMLDLLFISLLHLSSNSETEKPQINPIARIEHIFPIETIKKASSINLVWTWQIHNPTAALRRDINFKGLLPMLQCPGQRLTKVAFSRPACVRTDALGHALVDLNIDQIAPFDSVRLDVQVELAIHPDFPAPVWSGNEALKPSPFVESVDKSILTLAANLNSPEAASLWIGKNIRSLSPCAETLGARRCLDKKEGDCTEKACLMAALCRAEGYPALPVFGFEIARSGSLSQYSAHDCLYVSQNGLWQRHEPGAKQAEIPPFIAFRLIGSPLSTLLGGEVRHHCSDVSLEITMNPK
jgi:hypothetical protein